MKFSVVMAVRGTRREYETLPRALRAAAALDPDEIITAIDDDAPKALSAFIKSSCPLDVRIIRVPRDSTWKFQLANVVYTAYSKASNDAILCTDADGAVLPEVLRRLQEIGRGGTALISFTKNLYTKGIATRIRNANYKKRIRKAKEPFSGIYWIWRPHYLDLVRPDEFRLIGNGIDAYLLDRIRKSESYSMMCYHEPGVDSFDIQSEDYPWRQFHDGIHAYACAPQLYRNHRIVRAFGRLGSIAVAALTTRRVLISTINSCYPWYMRGFLWAMLHRSHPAINAARSMSLSEWDMYGGIHTAGIRDWSMKDRCRTGYVEVA